MEQKNEKMEFDIPCEFCNAQVSPQFYERHLKICSKNPEHINQDRAGIPCEICGKEIPFEEYNRHSESHSQQESRPQQESQPRESRQSDTEHPRGYPPRQSDFNLFSTISQGNPFQMIQTGDQGSFPSEMMMNSIPFSLPTGTSYVITTTRGPFGQTTTIRRDIGMPSDRSDPFSMLSDFQRPQMSEAGQQRPVLGLHEFLSLFMGQTGEGGGLESFFEQMGVRPPDRGFKKEDLDRNFITAKFDKAKSTGLEEENKKCAICLADFEDGDELRFLECCHRFHVKCIDYWLKSKTTCPICKKDFKNFEAE